jgi:hypothetical protein
MLGRERGVHTLSRALALTSDDKDAHQIAIALLALAFGSRRIRVEGSAWGRRTDGKIKVEYWGLEGETDSVSVRSLDDIQWAALQALTASDPVWRAETNLFTGFGLPRQRNVVATLIM